MPQPQIISLPPSPYSLVCQTLPLEKLTPPLAYELLGLSAPSFLLESVKGVSQIARYSFLGADPFLVFKSRGKRIELSRGDESRQLTAHPFKELQKLLAQYHLPRPDGFPPFLGGAVGYISYDACHFFERLPSRAIDDLQLPELFFLFVDSVVVFDHQEKRLWLLASGIREKDPVSARQHALEWVEETAAALSGASQKGRRRLQPAETSLVGAGFSLRKTRKLKLAATEACSYPTVNIESNFSQTEFEAMVRRAKEYIRAGDIFQVNLSQRLQSPISGSYWDLYKLLRKINPSPFAAFLSGGDFSLVSCSPERLVRLEGRQVDTRPIAGTRPRGRDGREDQALSAELLLNEKERAEHIMLVDLERNDLGRICEYGSVRVDELMLLEDYSHVFHIVSNVQGRLLSGKDCFDVLAACFPGGTITGTPKIRAMEIIDELEPTRRGPYTGSIGYLSFCGNMDFNIIIRTFLIKDNTAYVQVGAGIVADSEPEREYRETLHKAEALLQTLQFHSLTAS